MTITLEALLAELTGSLEELEAELLEVHEQHERNLREIRERVLRLEQKLLTGES